ncbi:MAG: hypothetical protein MI924_02990 [Chloroflexales bacterium]|nr:hypothetical protein [Chloroflexales bacterium]
MLLGVLHGRDSFRGAWVWAARPWGRRWRPLGAHGPHFPGSNTVHELFAHLDADDLDCRLRPWFDQLLDRPRGGVRADGTVVEVTVITSCSATSAPPHQLRSLIRQHGSIEQKAHWPRDVRCRADRFHGRQIGVALA